MPTACCGKGTMQSARPRPVGTSWRPTPGAHGGVGLYRSGRFPDPHPQHHARDTLRRLASASSLLPSPSARSSARCRWTASVAFGRLTAMLLLREVASRSATRFDGMPDLPPLTMNDMPLTNPSGGTNHECLSLRSRLRSNRLMLLLNPRLRMNDDDVCQEIFARAAEAVGGEEALARYLRRDLADVQAWLHGTQNAPMSVYFEACLLLLRRRHE